MEHELDNIAVERVEDTLVIVDPVEDALVVVERVEDALVVVDPVEDALEEFALISVVIFTKKI